MKKLFAAAAALSVLLAGSAFAADQNADKKVLFILYMQERI